MPSSNLYNNIFIKSCYYFYSSLKNEFKFNIFSYCKNLIWYFGNLKTFISKSDQKSDKVRIKYLTPRLSDKSDKTDVEPIYFYQDTWAAAKLFSLKPKKHIDLGSSVKTIGIISQFTPTVFVDIRPPDIKLPNLSFIKADILKLPFKSGGLRSISSMCVLEHIGLGRYGDKVDPRGSEKAITEVQRVLAKGGYLLVSVPVDVENSVHFNVHRTFTREYILSLFNRCKVIEEKYIYGARVFNKYDRRKGFGTGLFQFIKI